MCWVGYGFNLTDLSYRITIRASNEKKLRNFLDHLCPPLLPTHRPFLICVFVSR